MIILLYQKKINNNELISLGVHITEVFNQLLKLGYTIIFIDGSNYSIINSNKVNNNTRNIWIKIKKYLGNTYFKAELLLIYKLIEEIELAILAFITILRKKPDVIYRRHDIYNSEYILSNIFKIPNIREVNAIVIDEIKTEYGADKLSLRIINSIEKYSFKKANKYIVVTNKLKEVINKEYKINKNKIINIENGANIEIFKPMDKVLAKQKLNLDIDCIYICFVGILYRWQGLDDFIYCMPYILKEYPNTRALIIGNGIMKDELISLSIQLGISKKVKFVGEVIHMEVPLYINASDICVVPKKNLYRCGHSPLKLCEYMACSKPVVATNAEGFEILEENRAGLLINPQDSQEFANAIIKLLRDPVLIKQMGENGRKYVLENRSWESVARKVAEVCNNIVKEKNIPLSK